VLAGGFLALLSYLPKKPSPNRFRNSVLGMLVGTPLGVCVNCVAPIAKGIYDAGSRMETALAVMFSSPTLNIVVLTMLFSIFPFYMAVMKVGATFLMVLVVVPLISKNVPLKKPTGADTPSSNPVFTECEVDFYREPWGEAFAGAMRDLWRCLKYIVIRTFPLMLLAGLMGAVLSHMISLDKFIGLEPDIRNLSVLALLGTFLPLPIAFDLMLTQAMMMSKLADGFVMTLLFTLGTFSVYSAMVVSRTFSLWVAVKLFVIVAVVGVGVGVAVDRYSHYRHIQWLEQYDAFTAANPREGLNEVSLNLDVGKGAPPPQPFRFAATAPRTMETVMDEDGLRVSHAPHRKRSPKIGGKQFHAVPGPGMGLDYSNRLTPETFIDPFYFGRGIASGDINHDGWVDVAVATDRGFELYQNLEGERFEKLNVPLGEINGKQAVSVALADMNNDGWLDVFLTTFEDGNYLWLNPGTREQVPTVLQVPNGNALLTSAVAFADVDGDGWLDIANGNYYLGILTRTPVTQAANHLVLNKELRFETRPLPGIPGQTHSVLFSDFNNDGVQDLGVGNDYRVADTYYLGHGGGDFQKIRRRDNVIPITTENTMSLDTGDFNNDRKVDLAVSLRFDKIVIFLGNGDGSFKPAEAYKAYSLPARIVVGDYDNDGNEDLAVAFNGVKADYIRIFPGNGNGTFQPPKKITGVSQPAFIAQADMNGDGHLDLATSSQTTDSLTLFLGDGKGEFSRTEDFAGERGPRYIVPGEFTGDNIPDLMVLNERDGSVSLLEGRGDGSFIYPHFNYPVGRNPRSMAGTDFNKDGLTDLAVLLYDSAALEVFMRKIPSRNIQTE